MRKVIFFATATLLVLGSVTAAKADVSIVGNIEFEYESGDAADDMNTDGSLDIVSTVTADNGITYGVNYSQKMETTGVDAFYASVSSEEIGAFYLGNADDDATGMMDGAVGINNDIESENAGSSTEIGTVGNMVTYMSPNFGGLQIGTSADANTDQTSFAVTYDMAGVSVYFGSLEDKQNMGVKLAWPDSQLPLGR